MEYHYNDSKKMDLQREFQGRVILKEEIKELLKKNYDKK